MAKKIQNDPVRSLLAAITGRTAEDGKYVGRKIHGVVGTKSEFAHGKVISTSTNDSEDCILHVLWSDGKRTYPDAKNVITNKNGELVIIWA